MKTMIQRHLLGLLALSCLSGCVPMVIGGGMAATTNVVGQDRDMTSQVEDSWVAMKIRSRYVQSDLVRVGNVGVSVLNGKVLLTGSAINQEEVDEAIRIARETRGVVDVRSELRVQYVSPSELANDALITSKVKSKFFVDQQIHGLNIHVKTTKGVVYLTGDAQTAQERDQAIQVARQVGDVHEVVSYITVVHPAESSKPSGAEHGHGAAAPAAAGGSSKPSSVGHEAVAPAVSGGVPKISGTINESVSPVAAPGTANP